MTLVELLIATALIGIGVIAAVGSFKGITQSIQASKGRSLAANIAQEKVQILMQKSYYEILVTTAPNYVVEPSSTIAYDPGYFPPEVLNEGGMQFTRYTNIQVAQENSGAIQILPPETPDTGMRQITETVIWHTDSGDRFLTVQNVINNPSTVMANAVLLGVVKDANGVGIANGLVDAAENIGWRDNTDNLGNYLIHLSPGSLTFQASAPGYYPAIIPLSIAPNTTTTQNFTLSPISSGTIKGSAWLNSHLVISQVVASTGPSNSQEYVEIYNPSTTTVLMGTNATNTTANVWVVAADVSGNLQSKPQLYYMHTTAPATSYYLISNTWDGAYACQSLTINGTAVTPDACWLYAQAPNHLLQCNPLPIAGTGCPSALLNGGGVGLGTNGGTVWTGAVTTGYDAVGWTGNGTPTIYESVPLTPPTSPNGLQPGEEFIRRIDTGPTMNATTGNAYNSSNNSVDFFGGNTAFAPRNSASSYLPTTGAPAAGAVISVTDGLSLPSSTTITGNPPYAQFLIPGVATGTWSVFADSVAASAEVDNVIVLGNSTTTVNNIILSTTGVMGMVNGKVLDATNTPIAGRDHRERGRQPHDHHRNGILLHAFNHGHLRHYRQSGKCKWLLCHANANSRERQHRRCDGKCELCPFQRRTHQRLDHARRSQSAARRRCCCFRQQRRRTRQ